MMNSATAMANVGTNHLRSLGFSAGRKNASSCQIITGDVATSAAHTASWKRTENASNGSRAVSWLGRYCWMGMMRKLPMVGVAM